MAGPVRHTVMLKLLKKADKHQVAGSLRQMEKGLPGVTWTSFNVVTDLELVEANADVCLIAEFPDKENYLAYAAHPEHLGIVANNKPFVANRLAVQYSLPAKL